ncbi:hypothetical protein Tsubulata_035515 [Turnera subulata]|uniref:Uncharacterized protein n=1 Tax=Turnera subulata TaxID=218843 RepID=A0A9Q0FEI0_9ROSI|nr:hypothetical protein Tsubulata_035515 [Turnera subulata]
MRVLQLLYSKSPTINFIPPTQKEDQREGKGNLTKNPPTTTMKASGFRCLSQLKRQILQPTMRELKAETRICAPYTHKYLFLSHLLLNSKPQTHQNPSLKTTHHQLPLLHKTQVGSYSSRRALASRPGFMGSSGENKSSSGPESPSDTLSPGLSRITHMQLCVELLGEPD